MYICLDYDDFILQLGTTLIIYIFIASGQIQYDFTIGT